MAEPAPARIEDADHVLVAPPERWDEEPVREFFGTRTTPRELAAGTTDLTGRTVYLYGGVPAAATGRLGAAARVFVVREPSPDRPEDARREDADPAWPVVDPGRVPARAHGAGVYYRRFFAPEDGHFERIGAEHAFQSLTESTKPGTAHRSGIYLTPVRRDGADLHFRLLRCSTNLSGPTEGFRATDTRIVEELDREAATLFRGQAPLNHVLAQIYHNTPATDGRRQSKARISAHADKTKDMPANGIMAFCTFYDRLDGLRPLPGDAHDLGVDGVSALTGLRFRLKERTAHTDAAGLPPDFTLTLHPGSVFFMPLSTNRLYTHEIRPSALPAELLPTRLGYVVRCSNAEAVHRDGRTFLKTEHGPVELEPPTQDAMDELRRSYAEENRSTSRVDYTGQPPFSMNAGDYLAPRA
ncbi:hypothetical protein [Kitasatospora phosalacinea]|uniref:hypothetical protein n=1 Tax=Kitasatospora phosalacinea TaxID=2065 RepID=UPI000526170E|nr:hypothetical protein [Kitasatospora phosalacinea]